MSGGEIRFGAEGNKFVEGRHLSPISGEGDLQSIVRCQSARSGAGLFLAVSPGFVAGCVARFVTDGVVRCSNSGVWFWLSLRCDQGIALKSNSLFLEQSSGSKRLLDSNK